MTSYTLFLNRKLALLAGLFFTPLLFAANPVPPEQVTELGQLYQTYNVESQAAIAARTQAEILQTEIVTQQASLTELQGQAERAETELMELQEFDRKKPGKVKPEEVEAARSKHMQIRAEVEAAQRQIDQQQSKFNQLKEDFAKKNFTAEHSITAYRTRFEALAVEAVTRRVNSYKIPQQITESANIPCEDLALSVCKVKTQQEVERRVIEKGAIIVVDSITEIKNLTLQKDEVRSEVHGEISNLKILETNLTDEPATYSMKIQATVTPVIGDSLLAEIQRTVRADMSLQVGDGGLAFNTPETNTLAPIETASNKATLQKNDVPSLLKKAQAGNAQAQYEIALMYDRSGVKMDEPKAVEWYGKAAAQGHVAAQAGLARAYRNGIGVKKDEAKAKKLTSNVLPTLEKLAQRGDPFAQYELGMLYKDGAGVVKDSAKAFEWTEKAALQGLAYAQLSLGSMYDFGPGVAKDESKAFEWYEKAALQGNAHAQYNLGAMYYRGTGVAKDENKAFEWVERAASQGFANAQYVLAQRYRVDTKDEVKAFELYEKAALQGNAEAQFQLGLLYLKGTGVSKDEIKAFEWFKKAALQGHSDAQSNLGWMYETEKGVAKNEANAFKWTEKAALQGNVQAQYNLGRMYLYKIGVSKDVILSYAWFNLSSARGLEAAKLMRDEMALSASQRAEAERLSSNWKLGKPMQRAKK